MSVETPLRVLYVEDSVTDADLVSQILRRSAGMDVMVANSIQAARACLSQHRFDVLLTDYHLPDGGGLDLLDLVRREGLALAVVLITGEGNEDLVVAALKAGVDDYLPKRYESLERLPMIVRSAHARFCSRAAVQARTLRVLYVESNSGAVSRTQHYLARHAPHVALVALPTADLCLEQLARERYDVVLADSDLPDMGGLDLLKEINERGFDLPVVLLARSGSEDLAAAALRLGAADYVIDHDGYLLQLVPTVEHVVARARLEREQLALRASEERFRSLFEHSHDALFVCDDSARCVEFNAAACVLTGLPHEQLLHRSLADLIPETDRTLFSTTWATFLAYKRWDGELSVLRADGGVCPTDIGAVADLAPGLHLVALRDVSARKQAEEQLRQSQAQLIHAEKLAALGQLISGVAHELNNPLASIIGYAQLLYDADVPREVRSDIELIEAQANRARRVVSNLLTFARRHAPERCWVDINDLLGRTLELRSYDLRTNQIAVISEMAPDLPLTVADPYQLQQVFLNLLLNAEQAINDPAWRERAGVTAHIQVATSVVGAGEAGDRSGEIRITVSDNGPGMAPETQRRIFEPFFTTKPVGSGTGLGLAIAYGIMREHDGRIWAESTLGSGTAMHLALPIVSELPSARPEGPYVGAPSHTGARVLVVDDEVALTALLQRSLERAGLYVDVAHTGHQALHRLQYAYYDVLLCDLRIPDLSGQQLYAYFLQVKPWLSQRVIFMTGDVANQSATAFLEQTGCPYLIKPFDLKRLIGVIDDLLATVA